MIKQDSFVKLSPDDLEIYVSGYRKHLIRKTDYLIEIGIERNEVQECFRIVTRYKMLKALDQVLAMKFKNLKFPPLPPKQDLLNQNKEETRLAYIREMLSKFVYYARNHQNLKPHLYAVLYNFLFKQKIEKIKEMSQNQYLQDPLENGVVEQAIQNANITQDGYLNSSICQEFTTSNSEVETFQTLISSNDVFSGYMDESAVADKLMSQNSKDCGGLLRSQTIQSSPVDNCVQVYNINKKELIKQAHLEFSNPQNQQLKEQPFKGHAWVRMPNQSQWYRVYMRIESGCINICKDIATNDFAYLYVLFNCEIDLMQLQIKPRSAVEWFDVYAFKHTFDEDYLLVSFEDVTNKEVKSVFKKLVMKSIEIAPCIQGINETNSNSFGKLRIKIINLENIVCSRTYFCVQITVGPFVVRSKYISGYDEATYQSYKTSLINAKKDYTRMFNFQLAQAFYIPISNRFGQVMIEIISTQITGYLRDREQEKVIFSEKFPIPVVRELQQNESKRIKIDFKTSSKTLDDIVDGPMRKEINQDKMSSIVLELTDQSSILHEVAFNPNKGVCEDKVMLAKPEIKDLTLVLQRFDPILDKIMQLDDLFEKPLFFFKYPRLSKFWCVLIVSFVMFFDARYTLSYILALLCVLVGLQKPEIKSFAEPYLKLLFWDHQNKYIKSNLKVMTVDDVNLIESANEIMTRFFPTSNEEQMASKSLFRQKTQDFRSRKATTVSNTLRATNISPVDSEEDELFIDEEEKVSTNFKQEITKLFTKQKEKSGFRDKIKKLQTIAGEIIFEVGWYFDLIDKIYKMLCWEQPRTSDKILYGLCLAWFAVTFIPLRTVISLAIINKFITGSQFYKRRWISNYQCSKCEIRNLLFSSGLKGFKEVFESNDWLIQQWPKKIDDKVLRENFLKVFKIVLPDDVPKHFKTPDSLCREVAYVDEILHLNTEEKLNLWDVYHNEKIYYKSMNPILYIRNLLLNTICSQIYLYENHATPKEDQEKEVDQKPINWKSFVEGFNTTQF